MERITDAMVLRLLKRLQDEGMDLGIDGQYGQFRVTNKDESRSLSPRGPKRMIYDWLFAFEAGFDAGKEFQFNKMRKEVAGVMEDV